MGRNFFNVAPGQQYGGSQNPSSNVADTLTTIEQIKSARLRREQIKDEMERAKRGDVTAAQHELERVQTKEEAKAKEEARSAAIQVYGIDPDKDASIGPYVQEEIRNYTKGNIPNTQALTGPSGEPTGNIIGTPGTRDPKALASRLQKVREEKYAPSMEAVAKITGDPNLSPDEKVARITKIVPGSPAEVASGKAAGDIAAEDTKKVQLDTQRKLAGPAVREAESKALQEEAKARRIPMDDEYAILRNRNEKATVKINEAQAAVASQSATLDLKTRQQNLQNAIDQGKYHRLQYDDLVKKDKLEEEFRQEAAAAVANNDYNALRKALSKIGSANGEFLANDFRARVNTWDNATKLLKSRRAEVEKDIESGKSERLEAAETSVHEMNHISEQAANLLDLKNVDVYSIQALPGGWTNHHALVVTQIPREMKEKIDKGQWDKNNWQEAKWAIKMRMNGFRNNPQAALRAIETEGTKLGIPPQVIRQVQQDYTANTRKEETSGKALSNRPIVEQMAEAPTGTD